MKTPAKPIIVASLAILTCFLAVTAIQKWVRQARAATTLNALLKMDSPGTPPSPDPQALAERDLRAQKLYALWQAREQRNVALEVTPFIKDAYKPTRKSAAHILARLERPEAIPAIESELQNLESPDEWMAAEFVALKFAVARIQTRNLTGQRRLNVVANHLNLSWEDVIQLSGRVNAPRAYAEGSGGHEFLEEIVDLLYAMGRKGERIEALYSRLSLKPSQHIKLQSASLPVGEEAQFVLDYLSTRKVLTHDVYNLLNHLCSAVLQADSAVVSRLKDMKTRPARYPDPHGYKMVFLAAAERDNPEAMELVQEFEAGPNQAIKAYAFMARKVSEREIRYPPLP